MKYINHVTLNTGNNVQYKDDSVITKRVQPMIQEMVIEAIKNREIEIVDGIKLDCVINPEEKSYMATIFVDKPLYLPLIKTAGAVNECGAENLWPIMERLFQNVYGMKTPAICPKTPFICDVVYWSAIFRTDVTEWSGDFTKCFGIEMLKMLSGSKERK